MVVALHFLGQLLDESAIQHVQTLVDVPITIVYCGRLNLIRDCLHIHVMSRDSRCMLSKWDADDNDGCYCSCQFLLAYKLTLHFD